MSQKNQKFYFEGVDLNDMIFSSSSTSTNTIETYYTNFPGSTSTTNHMTTGPTGFSSSENGTTFSKYIHKSNFFCYGDGEEHEAPPFMIDNEPVFSKMFTATANQTNRVIVKYAELTTSGDIAIPSWCNAVKLYFLSKKGSDAAYGGGSTSQNYSRVYDTAAENYNSLSSQDSDYWNDFWGTGSNNHRQHRTVYDRNRNYHIAHGYGGKGGDGVVMFFYKYIKFPAGSGNTVAVIINSDEGESNSATLNAQGARAYTWEWGNGNPGTDGTLGSLNAVINLPPHHQNFKTDHNHNNDDSNRRNHTTTYHKNNIQNSHTGAGGQVHQGSPGADGNPGSFDADAHPHYVKYTSSSVTSTSVKVYFFKYNEKAVIPAPYVPPYDLECLNFNSAMTTVVDSGSNKFLHLNGETTYNADRKYGLTMGTYKITGVPTSHPVAIVNATNSNITYTGDQANPTTDTVDGISYNFYHGDVTITVSNDFDTASLYSPTSDISNGGGEDLLKFSFSCPAPPQILCLDPNSAMKVINNKFLLNGETSYNDRRKYGLNTSIYTITGVPSSHPVAIVSATNSTITYTGDLDKISTKDVDSISYNFYYGDVTIEVDGDFGTASLYCYNHGYMGGEDLLTFSSDCTSPPQILCLDPSGNMNVVDSGGNKFLLNGETSYNQYRKYGLNSGIYKITGVLDTNPIAIVNTTNSSYITYTGDQDIPSYRQIDDISYNFYHGDVTITVSGDFGTASLYEFNDISNVGGEDLLIFSNVCTSPIPEPEPVPEPDPEPGATYYVNVIESDWQEGTGINSFDLDPLPDPLNATFLSVGRMWTPYPVSTGHGVYTETGMATTGGSGSGATVDVTTNGDGHIDTVLINTIGSGYSVGNILTVTGAGRFPNLPLAAITDISTNSGVWGTLALDAPLSVIGMATTTTGDASGATVDVTTNANGYIDSVVLNNVGSGYASSNTLTVTASGGINPFTINAYASGIGGTLTTEPVHVTNNTTSVQTDAILFQGVMSDTLFKNNWPGWHNTGTTTYNTSSVSGSTGKTSAYDDLVLNKIKIADTSGRMAEYTMDSPYNGMTLLQIINNSLTSAEVSAGNDGGTAWTNGKASLGSLNAFDGFSSYYLIQNTTDSTILASPLRVGVGVSGSSSGSGLTYYSSAYFTYSGSGTQASPMVGESTNKNNEIYHSTVAEIIFIVSGVSGSDIAVINSTVSSEFGYDFAGVYLNDIEQWRVSGPNTDSGVYRFINGIETTSGSYNQSLTVVNGDTIKFKYTKDGSVHRNNDIQTFSVYISSYTPPSTGDWALLMPMGGNGSGDMAGNNVWNAGGESSFSDAKSTDIMTIYGTSHITTTTTTTGEHGVSLSVTGMATTVSPAGGSGATVDVTTDATGYISSVVINNIGSGYSVEDILTVTGSGGINSFDLNAITAVTINSIQPPFPYMGYGGEDGGYGAYTETGMLTTGGSGSGLTVNVTTNANGGINGVVINNPGDGNYLASDVITVLSGPLKFYLHADDSSYTAATLTKVANIKLETGLEFTFIQSHISNTNHPLAITSGDTYSSATILSTSTTAGDGTITTTYTPSTTAAAGTYVYINCHNHVDMGSYYNGSTGIELLIGGGEAPPDDDLPPDDGY